MIDRPLSSVFSKASNSFEVLVNWKAKSSGAGIFILIPSSGLSY